MTIVRFRFDEKRLFAVEPALTLPVLIIDGITFGFTPAHLLNFKHHQGNKRDFFVMLPFDVEKNVFGDCGQPHAV